jgi:hypothetical protein
MSTLWDNSISPCQVSRFFYHICHLFYFILFQKSIEFNSEILYTNNGFFEQDFGIGVYL